MNELGQVRQVGPLQSLDQMPAAWPVEVLGGEPVEGCVFEVIEVAPARNRVPLQARAADEILP